MTQFSYTTALQREWFALAASGRLLVVRIDDDAELLTRIKSLEIGTLSVHETLDALTEGGLARTPAFGLCFWVAGTLASDGVGVIVFGDAEVVVTAAGGDVTVRATGVSGWGEQLVEDATGIDVLDGADTAAALPLRDGAAWVAGVSLMADEQHPNAGAHTASIAAVESDVPESDSTSEPQNDSEPQNELVLEETAEQAEDGAADVPDPDTLLREPSNEAKPSTVAIDEQVGNAPPPLPQPAPFAEQPEANDEPKADTAEQPAWTNAEGSEPVGEDTEIPEMTLLPSDVNAPVELPQPDEQTIVRTPGQPVVAPRDEPLGDHDGMTVLAEDVRAARNAAHLPEGATAAPQDMPQYAYALELPGGGRQQLDAPVVLGRAPSVSNVPASVLPHLVTLAGDDISRTHVRVAVEGDAVVVTDLHSSNGTVVDVPGRSPQQLRGGEPVPVMTGTVIDLGSGVKLRVLEA